MKRKELLFFIFIFSGAILAVFGMSVFEMEKFNPLILTEGLVDFAVFALSALLIAFCEKKLPVFLISLSAAAALVVFSKSSGILFSFLIFLLLFYRYSDVSSGNKILSLTALVSNALCLVIFGTRISDTTDLYALRIGSFKEDIANVQTSFRLLLLVLILFLVFCAVNGIRRTKPRKKHMTRALLFWIASLLTAGLTLGHCVLFFEEYISALLLFAWLFFLVFVQGDMIAVRKPDIKKKTV